MISFVKSCFHEISTHYGNFTITGKKVRENIVEHTVIHYYLISQIFYQNLEQNTVWKLQDFTLTLFWQKIRESIVFTKELIWRNIFRCGSSEEKRAF